MTQDKGSTGQNGPREEETDSPKQATSKEDYDNYYSSLGIALQDYKMRNFSECIPLFRELLDNPVVKGGRAKAVNILNHLAHSLYGTGERDQARERFQEVTGMDPVNEMANYGLYCLYEEQQDFQKALEHLKLLVDNHISEDYLKELLQFFGKHGMKGEATLYLSKKEGELKATNPDKNAPLIAILSGWLGEFGDQGAVEVVETEEKTATEEEAEDSEPAEEPEQPPPEEPTVTEPEDEDEPEGEAVEERPSEEPEQPLPEEPTVTEPEDEAEPEGEAVEEKPVEEPKQPPVEEPEEQEVVITVRRGLPEPEERVEVEAKPEGKPPEPEPQKEDLSEAEKDHLERKEAEEEAAYHTVLVEREKRPRVSSSAEDSELSARQRDILRHKLEELDAERDLLRRREQQLEDQARLNALRAQELEDMNKSLERRRQELLNFEKKTLERVKQAQELLQQEREELEKEKKEAPAPTEGEAEKPAKEETPEEPEKPEPEAPAPETSFFQSKEAEEHFHRGNELFRQHLFEQAVSSYKQALTEEPDIAEVWNNMGVAFDEMGLPTKALQCYDEAIGLDANYRDAYLNKGYNLLKSQLFESAGQAFGKVLEIDPRSEEAQEYLEFCKGQIMNW